MAAFGFGDAVGRPFKLAVSHITWFDAVIGKSSDRT
jgi:hypothetical protein